MLKLLKYFFVINLYNKAKKQFVILAISLMIILLSGLIISDVMTVVSGINLYVLLVLKWFIIISMVLLIAFTLSKIMELATPTLILIKNTKEITVNNEAVNSKKEIALKKGSLLTESEMIIQKYTKDTK